MTFFKYRRYLEQQVKELKEELKDKDEKMDKLVQALVPVLRQMNQPKALSTAAEIIEKNKPHEITKDDKSARCSCGWHVVNTDPAKLQEFISEHYVVSAKTLRSSRKSWPQMKSHLESEGETA